MDIVNKLLPAYTGLLIGCGIGLLSWLPMARLWDRRHQREETEAEIHKREIAIIEKLIAMEMARRVPSPEIRDASTEAAQTQEVM